MQSDSFLFLVFSSLIGEISEGMRMLRATLGKMENSRDFSWDNLQVVFLLAKSVMWIGSSALLQWVMDAWINAVHGLPSVDATAGA